MVYTDGVHLVADSLAELHEFADKILLKRCWFQNHHDHPHYDILGKKVKMALDAGAQRISSKELLPIAKRLAVKPCDTGFDGKAIEQAFNMFSMTNQMFGNHDCK